ncbi:MAG: two component system sensor kinase [Plesiomonas sp.]|uniref:two component system sensor kinase n=1 Tax=Plesiomonas sp. TaxID=2486279 RepID=UPI003F318F02
MKNTSSLVTRLTLFLGVTLIVIWLISVLINIIFSFTNNRHQLLDNLAYVSTLRAELANRRFLGVEHDANILSDRRAKYEQSPLTAQPLMDESYGSYIPLLSGQCQPEKEQCHIWIVQAYGTADQTYYLDSFIFNRDSGITIFPPQYSTQAYLHSRKEELLTLPKLASHDNIFWGNPVYFPESGWHVSVAAAGDKNILSGFALNLDELISYTKKFAQNDISLWLDKNNQLLPFSNPNIPADELQSILTQINQQQTTYGLHNGWQQTADYLVWRTELSGPHWQQITVYPRSSFTQDAILSMVKQLPSALLILLLLSLALFLSLRYYLAVPLWNFVNIIDNTGPHKMGARLPRTRTDELGHIARAYNRLLDTLHEQHITLEAKVTERTQQLAEAKHIAELANQRKSNHLTNISHEIRTPLNGAMGAIELLTHTPITEEQLALIDTAKNCTQSLLHIINNLLDFSSIESGQFSINVEKIALLPLIDQSMLTIQCPAQLRHIQLSTFIAQDVPLYVEIDGLRLRQVLINLLGNAAKFTYHGSITLHVSLHGNNLVFLIIDTGCGISEEDQKNIFEPFFQGSHYAHGTGLGLAITANITALMHGSIHLESTLGKGTTVSVKIPITHIDKPKMLSGELAVPFSLHSQLRVWGLTCLPPENICDTFDNDEFHYLPYRLRSHIEQYLQPRNTPAEIALPVQAWQLKVLLVDDAEINRDITGKMIIQLGHTVHHAASGIEALYMGQCERFDLVLMDIRMPGMDGFTTTKKWRKEKDILDKQCMIVALTANAASTEQDRIKDAGMNDYLTKPVNMKQLAILLDLAASYQLERNIYLSLQETASATLENPLLTEKIRLAITSLIQDLMLSLECENELSERLHTLKGCAGQAGLFKLAEKAEVLEKKIKSGFQPTADEIQLFYDLLN